MKHVTIPENIASIAKGAFNSCNSMKSITIENPKCEIDDSSHTISSRSTIYGYEGSTAQAYAEKYERKFVDIEKMYDSIETGDINGDGAVDVADVVLVKCYLINAENYSMTKQGTANADVDGKTGVTAGDALSIQRLDAKLIDKLPEKTA